jgi:dihydrolipoamide dehydrogenase
MCTDFRSGTDSIRVDSQKFADKKTEVCWYVRFRCDCHRRGPGRISRRHSRRAARQENRHRRKRGVRRNLSQRGCIPTKTLIASAERFHHAAHAEAFGIAVKGVSFDYATMAARKAAVVAKLGGGVQALLKSNGVEMIKGLARFEGPNRLSVVQPDGTTRWLSAASIIVAAGSDSAMPGFLPKDKRVMDSRAFLDLTELPKNLLILGGGVIGCEFACMAASLGSKVTVVEMLEDIVMVLDRDVRRVLRKRMEALGIAILTGAPLANIEVKKDKVVGTYKDQAVEGDVLLVAVGRRPNTAALDSRPRGCQSG